MSIEEDKRFQQAIDALLEVWYAEEVGESADEAAKWHRLLVGQLAEEYGMRAAEVQRLIKARAMERYE